MLDKTKAVHIAEAFRRVAEANHYMVSFSYRATREELEMAQQILIAWDNSENNEDETLKLALDLMEMEIKGCKL